jgi:predicted N-acetyltransferase YhbS
MTDAAVRLAHLDDAESLRQLYIELAADRADALPAEVDVTREVLAKIVAQSGRQLLVAEIEGGRIVGTVDLVSLANLTHAGRPWAIVENVIVAKEQRRQGIGRVLMQEAIQLAKQADCYKVQLLSGKQRSEAHDFYRSLGFEAIAEGFKVYFD